MTYKYTLIDKDKTLSLQVVSEKSVMITITNSRSRLKMQISIDDYSKLISSFNKEILIQKFGDTPGDTHTDILKD